MRLFIDCEDGIGPKRGDILQTNVGDRRERTCLVLRVHQVKRAAFDSKGMDRPSRFNVWCERWWELEPDFRMRLYRSAERNGGQTVSYFHRYPAKKKKRDPFLYD